MDSGTMLRSLLAGFVTLLPLCAGYTFSTFQAYGGSVWNTNGPDLALTNDSATCFMTGREQNSWWKVKVTDLPTVSKVVLTGEYKGSLMVRVGTDHDNYDTLEGHESNLVCRQLGVDGVFDHLEFDCTKARVGDVISVNGLAKEPNSLKICDVQLY